MITSAHNEMIDDLMFIAGMDIDLVQEAIRMAAFRGYIQRGEQVANLEDVVAWIVAKRHCTLGETGREGKRDE